MPVARGDIERVRYWQGQTLSSRDFNDQLAHDASLRWWHNRAIHDTFGLVGGFRSAVRESELVVGPGLAYDCFGRELLSVEPRSLSLPQSDSSEAIGGWRLLVRAAPDQRITPAQLELVWLPDAALAHPEQGVSIARGAWRDGAFVLDRRRRPRVMRPLARPRMGNGRTVHGKTDWREWSVLGSFGRRVIAKGVEVEVDTSAAGFQRTPCYFVTLRGDPWIISAQARLFALERLVEATPRSLVFSLWILGDSEPTTTELATVAAPPPLAQIARRQWSICWLGIESQQTMFEEVKR